VPVECRAAQQHAEEHAALNNMHAFVMDVMHAHAHVLRVNMCAVQLHGGQHFMLAMSLHAFQVGSCLARWACRTCLPRCVPHICDVSDSSYNAFKLLGLAKTSRSMSQQIAAHHTTPHHTTPQCTTPHHPTGQLNSHELQPTWTEASLSCSSKSPSCCCCCMVVLCGCAGGLNAAAGAWSSTA
jgi:hypothetical protein